MKKSLIGINAVTEVISAGSLLIKHSLPDAVKPFFDPGKPLDKKGISSLMSKVIEHGGPNSHETIQTLSNLFFEKATEHGYSTPINDYLNDDPDRAALLGELSHKVRTIQGSKISDKDKADKIATVSGQYSSNLWAKNLSYMVGKGSTAGLMALTGARGNSMQFGQGTASPVMAQDIMGNPIPIVIKNSFAEGLTPAEHMAMAYGGRASTVKTQLSTSKPGALSKEITPNVYHEVITEHDCGTTNGVPLPLSDKKDIISRVEVGHHEFVTESMYKDMLLSNRKTVIMRSPLTCEAKEGICQMCYGRDSYGALPKIGQNVGTLAAQSVSEVLTQAMLSTKHLGGVAGRKRDAYEEANAVLHLPENFPNKATVSTLNGKVTKIDTDSLNVKHVFVNSVAHFVPSKEDVVVKVGDVLQAGDTLSTGMVNPAEIVKFKGMGAGRSHFARSLRDAYSLANPDLDTRHFDLIAKNVMKYVSIIDPGTTGYLPGQVVSVSKIGPEITSSEKTLSIHSAEGKVLSRAVMDVMPGQVLTANIIEHLSSHGVRDVTITNTGLRVDPVVKGVKTSKLHDENWMSRLALNNLKQSMTEAVSLGERAKIHGTDPIASYTLGHEFGEGGNGRY